MELTVKTNLCLFVYVCYLFFEADALRCCQCWVVSVKITRVKKCVTTQN